MGVERKTKEEMGERGAEGMTRDRREEGRERKAEGESVELRRKEGRRSCVRERIGRRVDLLVDSMHEERAVDGKI